MRMTVGFSGRMILLLSIRGGRLNVIYKRLSLIIMDSLISVQ